MSKFAGFMFLHHDELMHIAIYNLCHGLILGYESAAFPNPTIQNFPFTYLYKETFSCTNLNKFKQLDSKKQNHAFLLEKQQSSFPHTQGRDAARFYRDAISTLIVSCHVSYYLCHKVLNSNYSGIAGRSNKKAIANSVAIVKTMIHSDFSFLNFIFYIYTNYQHIQY